jgi:putative protease
MLNGPKPELLSPAGSPEKLRYAFAYGADAVYAGVPIFSLRARDNGFDWENLGASVDYAHQIGKKVYLTVNIFARNTKIGVFDRHIDKIAETKPDALIMSDPGLIMMMKDRHPEIPIHLSVQANCMNWQGVKFWQKIGVERVILSRELRLEEIKMIKDQVPEMELEAFVHGAICIAYSGRCLLSRYMSYRDANQGICDNSCRYPMKVFAQTTEPMASNRENGEESGACTSATTAPERRLQQMENTEFYLEDQRNPGELYRIDEDEHGTYIMNAKDLRLIQYLRELAEAGVCSFKIEGRTKSLFYLSVVTRAYRQAIDDLYAGKELNPELMVELERITRRGYHSGFLTERHEEGELYGKSQKAQDHSGFVGLMAGSAGAGTFKVDVRGKLEAGETYELLTPNRLSTFKIDSVNKIDGSPLKAAHPGMGVVKITTDAQLEDFSIIRKPMPDLEVEA